MVLSGNVAMTLCFRIIGCLSPDFDYAAKFAVLVSEYLLPFLAQGAKCIQSDMC
jgi:ATP-binding cassette, subfamily G (WHITE), member 2, SNQ2